MSQRLCRPVSPNVIVLLLGLLSLVGWVYGGGAPFCRLTLPQLYAMGADTTRSAAHGATHPQAVWVKTTDSTQIQFSAAQTDWRQGQKAELLHLFPNPTDGVFIFLFDQPDAAPVRVWICDEQGLVVHQFNENAAQVRRSVDLSGQKTGVYTVTVKAGGQTFYDRVAKQ